MAGQGRMLKGGTRVPRKPNVSIPMQFTVSNPIKNGATMRVVYDPGNIPFDAHGNVDPKYSPYFYKIKQMQTKIRQDENPELLVALAYHHLNAENILYDGTGKAPKGSHEFRLPKKGLAVKQSLDADTQLINALAYLIGEKRISNKKVYDLYKFYQLDPDVAENEDVDGMIDELKKIAKADPAKFIKDVTDTMYDMLARVTEAFEIGILKASESRKITWGETVPNKNYKETICTYAMGSDKAQSFTEWLTKKDISGEVRDAMLKALEAAQVEA